MKLDEDEVALFDAILAASSTGAPFGSADEALAKQAVERAEKFVEARRSKIPSQGGPT